MKPIINIDELTLRNIGNGNSFEARVGPHTGATQLGAQYHIVPVGEKGRSVYRTEIRKNHIHGSSRRFNRLF